ncbi:hypothetical protein KPL74_09070 [Bacillus sp. NP157]|nr:hypothetical protein KPL74_09070 [Bacillus sp. NP157]
MHHVFRAIPAVLPHHKGSPVIVAPRRFSARDDGIPYERCQTAGEVADWLAAFGHCLAPVTKEVLAWCPEARWMAWTDETRERDTWLPRFELVTELHEFETHYRPLVEAALLVDAFANDLAVALASGPTDQLDAIRRWLTDSAAVDDHLIPGVLMECTTSMLADVWDHPPGRPGLLTPRAWRLGARLASEAANGEGETESSLRTIALRLVHEEEMRRLGRLGLGRAMAARARL